jgi:hypothetical protein
MNKEIKYKVEFKKRTNWPFAIFMGLSIIVLFAILGTILYGLIGMPDRISDLAYVVVILILIGIWIVDVFLWQIRGVEQFVITNRIEIIKRGKLFKSVSKIDFIDFESITYDDDKTTPFSIKLYGLSGGKIRIKYLGRGIRFGQDISLIMAEIVAKEIDDEMRKYA